MKPLAENSIYAEARESEYNTYTATGQIAIPMNTFAPVTDPTLVERPSKVGSINELPSITTRKNNVISRQGDLYPGDEIGNLLWQMLGNATTTGASADKTHVFNMVESKIGVNSLSAEVMDFGQNVDKCSGIMYNTLTIEGGNEGIVTHSAEGSYKTRVTDGAMGAKVFTTIKPYRYFNATITYNGSPLKVDSWSISLDMALRLENFKQSEETEKPVLDGIPQATVSLTFDAADKANRAIFEAGTANIPLVITLTHSENIPTTSTKYSLKFQFPATQIESMTYDGDTGNKKENLNLKAYAGEAASTATTKVEATLVNGTAAYA